MTLNNILVEKEENNLTVLSQSFNSNLPAIYNMNFWDTIVQQQQLDQTCTFAKPIGGSSPDVYHESNPAVLPIGAPRMAIDDLVTGPTLDSSVRFMLFSCNIIKDDVFLAQPSTLSRDALYPISIDHDDTASVSSHSSLSSSQHSDKLSSPRLSPVTSPTNFLYNHEPLFEGGIIEEKSSKAIHDYEDEEYDDLDSVLTESTASEVQQQMNPSLRRLSTASDDLDWFKLLDAFRADVACDLPTPSETTLEDDDDHFSLNSNDSSESEEDKYFDIQPPQQSIKKRRRTRSQTPVSGMYQLCLSDNEDHNDNGPIESKKPTKDNVRPNPRQKRRKKSKAPATITPVKKSPKKKADHEEKKKLLPVHPILAHKSAIKYELDSNRETSSRCQLIEPIAESEKDEKTVFQGLTEASIDWCRYCGTTEGVNWRPGPWGKRTLCNKHGCDYKGYGLASRLPRLDLSAFTNEKLEERLRPVVQQFCIVCQSPEQSRKDNHLILCQGGCSRAYHQQCHTPVITVNPAVDCVRWFCSALCKENRKRNKVVVELPRKHMPLMHLLPRASHKRSKDTNAT